jgi:hypothetical protein
MLFQESNNCTHTHQTTSRFKMTGISTNYIQKIQQHADLEEELRTMLVNIHTNRDWITPVLLTMKNPKLKCLTSWHNTITSALDHAKILTGNFEIIFRDRTLTLQEAEAIRSCEEGELDPFKGCSIARAREVRELRDREQQMELYEDRFYHSLTQDKDVEDGEDLEYDEDDEFLRSLEEAENDPELRENLEMWLEKMDRPGRKLARGSDESVADILKREKAMREIEKMSPKEFQTRLLDGTLPDFPREKPPTGLVRDTCHEMRLLTEEDFANPKRVSNYAEHHKNMLRYMSVECYKYNCYNELNK